MAVLEHLEPKQVMHFFEQMSAIPRGSGNTKAISDWCVAFAKERGLEYHQDEHDNVILVKEATPGYESAVPVIIQGHLDMVCQKDADCDKDMATQGLDLETDGEYVWAKGTTLGSDDGIAVAMALALLDAKDIPHPRLEAVFTADEEIGMVGALAMDVSPLKGGRLINIDADTEGVFTVSCAGGNMTRCRLPLTRAPFAGQGLRITVQGLQGGHSGMEIHKGRGNSNQLLGRVLRAMAAATELRLISAEGGMKDNAIPGEASALVVVSDAAAAQAAAAEMDAALKNELRVTDPKVEVRTEPFAPEGQPADQTSTRRAMCLLTCAPVGVQAMSADIEGLVQTSLNLGILRTEGDELVASFCIRSSVESQKEMLKDRLACLMEQLGGTAEFSGDYPGWAYDPDSALRKLMVEVFREQYGREPKVEAIHAGVECGLFAGKIPGLDCVSIGPNLLEIHTPRERMSVSSVQRVWAFLLEVLRRSK